MFDELRQKITTFLTSRKAAYQFTFNPENVYSKAVLKDLSRFCRADKSTFDPNERFHCVVEGRREVWLRIQNHLNLTPDQLSELYRKD